jgi:probable rRNA maturation factor
MMHTISVSRDRHGLGYPEARALLRRAAAAALRSEGVFLPCGISALLTNDAGIRELNRSFRGMDKSTDVLSFPQSEQTPGRFDPNACDRDPETGLLLLGDIAVNLGRCAAQAAEYGHGFGHELMYLTVHSVLHLLGYDHMRDEEKRRMRAQEKAAMARLEGQ